MLLDIRTQINKNKLEGKTPKDYNFNSFWGHYMSIKAGTEMK